MRVAIDTGVLAYAEGVGDAERCGAAIDLVARLPEPAVVLPAQVLGELMLVLTRKAGRTRRCSRPCSRRMPEPAACTSAFTEPAGMPVLFGFLIQDL